MTAQQNQGRGGRGQAANNNRARAQALADRQRPEGWPVGSFDHYVDAQAAVDMLSDREFPVDGLTIVGVDLLQVEQVTGRLTWGRVLGGGAAAGAWMGLFVGLLVSLFSPSLLGPILLGLVAGAVFGLVLAAVQYGLTGGRRDFTSASAIVAGRYDILCDPQTARQARDMIAEMNLSHRGGQYSARRGAIDPAAGQQIPAGVPREEEINNEANEEINDQPRADHDTPDDDGADGSSRIER